MSSERLRLVLAGLALVIAGMIIVIDLRTGDDLRAGAVGVVSAFTTAAVALGHHRGGEG